jgi:hypothetical protein
LSTNRGSACASATTISSVGSAIQAARPDRSTSDSQGSPSSAQLASAPARSGASAMGSSTCQVVSQAGPPPPATLTRALPTGQPSAVATMCSTDPSESINVDDARSPETIASIIRAMSTSREAACRAPSMFSP